MKTEWEKNWKDKMDNYALPPSDQVWSNIESGLNKKKRAVVFFRWAAVLLLGMCGVIGYKMKATQSTEPREIAKTKLEKINTPHEKTTTNPVTALPKKENQAYAPTKKQFKIRRRTPEKGVVQTPQQDVAKTDIVPSPTQVEPAEEPVLAEVSKPDFQQPINTQEIESKPTTTEKKTTGFTLSYVIENEQEQTPTTEKKKSFFKKLWAIKNGEADLPDLKSMKENLYAHLDKQTKTTNH